MRGPAPILLAKIIAATSAVLALRSLLASQLALPPIWLLGPVAFIVAKVAGDIAALTLFRRRLVVFYEDMFWDFLAFAVLGLVAAGLIVVVEKFIGGPVGPYLPAIGVYAAYAVAESRPARDGQGEVTDS